VICSKGGVFASTLMQRHQMLLGIANRVARVRLGCGLVHGSRLKQFKFIPFAWSSVVFNAELRLSSMAHAAPSGICNDQCYGWPAIQVRVQLNSGRRASLRRRHRLHRAIV